MREIIEELQVASPDGEVAWKASFQLALQLVLFHVMGRILGFLSLFHNFTFIKEPSVWPGSRITTSPLGLLIAHGFECCCANVDASYINEVSAVRAGSSVKVLFGIWLIVKQGKRHTFSKGSMHKSSFLFCVKLQQSCYWKWISSLLPTSWKIISFLLWPQLSPSICQVLNDRVLHHFHFCCSVLPSIWWLQMFPNTCKRADYCHFRGMKWEKYWKQGMINLRK